MTMETPISLYFVSPPRHIGIKGNDPTLKNDPFIVDLPIKIVIFHFANCNSLPGYFFAAATAHSSSAV